VEGQDAAIDPKLAGFPEGFLQFAYYHADLGAKFLRQFFGEMDITISRDGRQIVDWLAVGKFAIAIGPSASDIQAGHEVESAVVPASSRALSRKASTCARPRAPSSILNRLPHPNATKVFVNWLLSREGQTKFQNHFMAHRSRFSVCATMLSWILASSPIGPSPVTIHARVSPGTTEICKAPIG